MKQVELKNEKIKNHQFLPCMYQDSYFPEFLVDKVKAVLIELCANIETENPSDLDQLYNLSHAAIGKINNLEDDFFENNSEIETAAANCIASDFEFIAESYGFKADVESLIETRNW